MKIWRVESNTH